MKNRVVATSAFGNTAEAARIREGNEKRQAKEAARPSAKKRSGREDFKTKRWIRKKLKKLNRQNPAIG